MKPRAFIFICILFLLVRTASAQVSSPAGGGYYSFEGNERSFLQASDSDFLDAKLQDEFTIELWIYPKRLPELGETQFLLQKLGSYDMYLTKIATEKGSFYWIVFRAGGFGVSINAADIAINQWSHVVINFKKNEPPSFKHLFINGNWKVSATNQPTEWPQLPLSEFLMLIGRRFDGAIDEIRISNIARYGDKFNFVPPSRRFEPDEHTMALWHFDGTEKNIFEDSSGNGNRLSVGVREQMAWWQTKAPMPTPRTEMSAIALGKKIYVFGGFDFSNNLFTTTEIYDSETDSWSLGVPVPEHVNHAAIGGHGIGVFNLNEVFILPPATTVAVEPKQKLLTTFGSVKQSFLGQNFPNPFNPETWIPYQLADSADVSIRIYDVSGRIMRMLNLGRKKAGLYLTRNRAAYWDGRNEAGEYLSNGVYFYELVAGSFRSVRKMAILK